MAPPGSGARLALIALALLTAALVAPSYPLYLLTRAALTAVAVLGLHVTMGLAGKPSLGHAAFVGVGAYTQTIAEPALGFLGALPVSLAASALAGLLVGVPALRFYGPYLALLTWGFQVAFDHAAAHLPFTGGRMGLVVPVPMEALGGPRVFAASALAALLFVWVLARWMGDGYVGRALVALDRAPAAAASCGVDRARVQLFAFAVAATLAGLAGALGTKLADVVHPDQFTVLDSVELMLMLVLGGARRPLGALVGAAAWSLAAEALAGLGALRALAFGIALLAALRLTPHGLTGARP